MSKADHPLDNTENGYSVRGYCEMDIDLDNNNTPCHQPRPSASQPAALAWHIFGGSGSCLYLCPSHSAWVRHPRTLHHGNPAISQPLLPRPGNQNTWSTALHTSKKTGNLPPQHYTTPINSYFGETIVFITSKVCSFNRGRS